MKRELSILIGLVSMAFLSACASIPSAARIPAIFTPSAAVTFELIEKLAADMSLWHFNSTEDIDDILKDVQALGITLSAQDLNCILDEDERKRLWRVGAEEYNVARLYGEEAQAVFKIRHYVSLAGLWVEVVETAGNLTERKAYIGIVAGNIGVAAKAVREVPANWDCWDVTGCEPRPPMREVTFPLDGEFDSEGEEVYDQLRDLSLADAPELKAFKTLMERAYAWDNRVCAALENAA